MIEDRLVRVRAMAKNARDLQLDIQNTEEKLDERKTTLRKLMEHDLVDLFYEADIDHLGIPAEGNMPAFDLKLKPFCVANIAASWPEEKKTEAFSWLDEHGAGDMIKSTITIELNRGDLALMKKATAALRQSGVEFAVKLAVPHGTLTAFIKEQIKKHKTPPLDVLGARVGETIKLEPRDKG
jgi:hypothetical protein